MRELTCIVCPKGCHLRADEEGNITGNQCPRGAVYGRQELRDPVRMVTSTVKVTGGVDRRTSVRTSQPVSKARIGDVMDVIRQMCVEAPVHLGDVLVANVAGTGADLIVTRSVESA